MTMYFIVAAVVVVLGYASGTRVGAHDIVRIAPPRGDCSVGGDLQREWEREINVCLSRHTRHDRRCGRQHPDNGPLGDDWDAWIDCLEVGEEDFNVCSAEVVRDLGC